jgi:hypothetical protein
MKKILVLGLVILLSAFSLQAKEKKEKKKSTESTPESSEQVSKKSKAGKKSKDGKKKDTKKEGEEKEAKVGAIPYPFTGPDTGFGLGISGLYRDILDKQGRDLTFSVSYTANQYSDFSIEWIEPQMFTKKGWGRFKIDYGAKPSRLFYGIGNDSSENNICAFGDSELAIEPRYDYWFYNKNNRRMGLKVNYRFHMMDANDGPVNNPKTLAERKISVVFPEFAASPQFKKQQFVSGFGLNFIYDDRRDKFPVGGDRDEAVFPYLGGRQELDYYHYDKVTGSDYRYDNYVVNLSYYLPLGWEWTVLALHANYNIKTGEVPWWDMNSFGSDSTLRGYHDGRFRDNSSILYQLEFRQAFDVTFTPAPFWILKQFKIRAPMAMFFYDYGRVYDKTSDIDLFGFKGYHYSYGVSFRFIISPSVLVRADYAFSDEESDFYLGSGWAF